MRVKVANGVIEACWLVQSILKAWERLGFEFWFEAVFLRLSPCAVVIAIGGVAQIVVVLVC